MDKTVVELFAGVGGFRCGFNHVTLENNQVNEENNWNFVWANQWEPSTKSQAAFDCYVKRFGKSSNNVNKDIASIDKSIIPDHTVLVGGFPCQDYSVARSLSNEQGIEGKKGVLWWQIAEVLKEKRPPFVLLENVDRLLRSPSNRRGRDFGIMLRTFLDYGYSVEWRVINAAEYGFPQKRRRVFIFAYHNSTKYYKKMKNCPYSDLIYEKGIFAKNFPIKQNYEKSLTNDKIITDQGYKTRITKDEFSDIVEVSDNFEFHFLNAGLMVEGNIYTFKTESDCDKVTTLGEIIEKGPVDNKYFLSDEKLKKFEYLKGSKKLKRKGPNGACYNYSEGAVAFPDYLDRPARTMLTSESTVNRSSHVIKDVQTGKYRILTPLEAERIQMFPDNWTNIPEKSMTERRRYFLMGNALVVGVVRRLGDYLGEIVSNEE
ncbi:DNA (cytosine-5-)-methyltransferase [uncultured Methanobrevibacter sp.]|uniref:DNA (cytosine-5-)-methyltransferase n=1 Tax=uncultured Methanobrevibacter sp. TaxID=253161 RepID=UPI00258B0C81|nr:DNA (cytosine-5-)-methyltransferase [uncultured Methanobrevibacter sp.]